MGVAGPSRRPHAVGRGERFVVEFVSRSAAHRAVSAFRPLAACRFAVASAASGTAAATPPPPARAALVIDRFATLRRLPLPRRLVSPEDVAVVVVVAGVGESQFATAPRLDLAAAIVAIGFPSGLADAMTAVALALAGDGSLAIATSASTAATATSTPPTTATAILVALGGFATGARCLVAGLTGTRLGGDRLICVAPPFPAVVVAPTRRTLVEGAFRPALLVGRRGTTGNRLSRPGGRPLRCSGFWRAGNAEVGGEVVPAVRRGLRLLVLGSVLPRAGRRLGAGGGGPRRLGSRRWIGTERFGERGPGIVRVVVGHESGPVEGVWAATGSRRATPQNPRRLHEAAKKRQERPANRPDSAVDHRRGRVTLNSRIMLPLSATSKSGR